MFAVQLCARLQFILGDCYCFILQMDGDAVLGAETSKLVKLDLFLGCSCRDPVEKRVWLFVIFKVALLQFPLTKTNIFTNVKV